LGKRKWNPIETPELIKELELFGLAGLRYQDIAEYYSISASTLHDYINQRPFIGKAIKRGASRANAKIAESLYNQALKGNVSACIFWLKTRMGWKEPAQEHHHSFEEREAEKLPLDKLIHEYEKRVTIN
jgi:hypothetical protein